ncbi:glycoside hydrolase family 16 protein [Aeromicrobium terrae]|uniref:Glycoside hydrolase family 16 protein n=1 Tax=Aeromicrobium terrae TaxID=2498846 RepID=A0A5C8NMA4_9ACTN|nr:glycoside hydrolase family 16 protein [Aeromicrobium terrae]TXL62055.1 glycoside hydrolase family 16 protein [Aeromicrobium terrae]
MRHSRRALGIASLLALLLLACLTVPAQAATTPYDGCGGKEKIWAGGSRFTCVFTDDFSGTTLDRSKWEVTLTETDGFHSGWECFMDDPATVGVRDGALNLTTTTVDPFMCGVFGSRFPSSWPSGQVTTRDRLEIVRGRVEVRAAFIQGPGVGLHSAIWMWPTDSKRYGPWPASGEIDIAEYFSSVPDRVFPFIHYMSARPDRNATSARCRVRDPGAFHTYTLTWTTRTMTVAVDKRTCLRDTWRPAAPLKSPAPFDQPFYLVLTQALGRVDGQNPFQPGVTQLPATMQVDSVYVWSQPPA